MGTATTRDDVQNNFPLPNYRFSIDIDDMGELNCSEISGLDTKIDPITYKDGMGIYYMPGQPAIKDVTFKRGILKAESDFFLWIDSTDYNIVLKKNINVKLIGKQLENDIHLTWAIANAFPIAVLGPSLTAGSNDVCVESMTVRADSIIIKDSAGKWAKKAGTTLGNE
jgi:phage tail-like protein